ncbi:MAG: cytochrome C [Nitrospirae bacterium]|nr:cytochrome C [Nitrospirota bacterium]
MLFRHARILLTLAVTTLLASTPAALAASFEELVMPGKVIAGHAKYESECSKCHQPFTKAGQSRLCLDCHDKVDGDIKGKSGFHGRIAGIQTAECKRCHSDHLGRGADVVQLDRETFDHGNTDFVLKGAHRAVTCDRCHKDKKPYRDAPHACLDCHKEDDPHDGKLGEKCHECHNERAWSDTAFDHKDTDFPLQGEHEKVLCNACHPNERYKKTPTTCHACHRLNDTHGGRYGEKCDTCHTPKAWDKPTFNHDKDTDYKLVERHKDVTCNACHTSDDLYDEKTPTTCHGCHRNDDEHKGRFGEKCDDCHAPKGWRDTAFDHDTDTDFPLLEKHAKLDCKACHQGTIEKEERGTDCYTCHRKDDVHGGEQGKVCDKCHNEKGWGHKVFFDHDLTRFPLIGLHAVTPCDECHLGATFKATAMDCDACHKGDDEHERRLGPDCAQCHNPNAWNLWRFDHDTQTDFELTGAHKGLACDGCHQRPVKDKIELSSACGDCHQQDDIHDGGFGPHCARCHTTEAFDKLRIES